MFVRISTLNSFTKIFIIGEHPKLALDKGYFFKKEVKEKIIIFALIFKIILIFVLYF